MPKSKKPAPKGGKKVAAPKKVAKKKPSKIIAAVAETREGLNRTMTARQIDQFNADKMRAEALAQAQIAAKPLHPTVEEQFEANRNSAEVMAQLAAATMAGVNYGASMGYVASKKPSLWHRFRSAVTGMFVSKKFAEANPDTTVREKAD